MNLPNLARLRDWPWLSRLSTFTKRHLLIGIVLLVAVAARIVAMLGYPPIRWIPDSWSYLATAMHLAPSRVRSAGYPAMLSLLKPFHSLVLVAGIQHAMGVAMGIMVYALLRHRFRLPGWGATLAALPVLLSAFGIQVEHYLISDTLFTFLITCAITLVLWRPVPTVWMCALAGLLLAAATLVRSEALPLAIPFLAYLVTRFRGWRTLAAGLATGAAFAIPVLGYTSWFQRENGVFQLTTSSGAFLYSRVAPFADCAKIKPPPTNAPFVFRYRSASAIIPSTTYGTAVRRWLGSPAANSGIWPTGSAPISRCARSGPSRWITSRRYGTTFSRPSSSAGIPTRTTATTPSRSRWSQPPAGGYYDRTNRAYNIGDPYPHLVEPYGSWIRVYQRFSVVPGPLVGLITLTGLIGIVAAWRRFGGPAVLPWLTGVVLIVVAAATAGIDVRYVQYGFPSLCVAAAIGAKEIVDRFAPTLAGPHKSRRRARLTWLSRECGGLSGPHAGRGSRSGQLAAPPGSR